VDIFTLSTTGYLWNIFGIPGAQNDTIRYLLGDFLGILSSRMVVWLCFENQFSWKLEAKLEMDVTLFGSILCDELWICSYAVENLFAVGTCHAWAFYHPDTHKPDESP
jgi:hypothetical protein